MGIREPAVAGLFYPADPLALTVLVDSLLDGATATSPGVAYVVPHAGYRYSGPTAACVYKGLSASVRRVGWPRTTLMRPAIRHAYKPRNPTSAREGYGGAPRIRS